MGFLNRLTTWINKTGTKVWNDVKSGASTGYHFVKNVAHKIGSLADGVDKALTSVRDLPIVGELATLIQHNPIYQDIKDGIMVGNKVVDEVGNVGNTVGQLIDTFLPGDGRS